MIAITLLTSCAIQPMPVVTKYPVKFEVAMRTLINDLLQQLRNDQGILGGFRQTKMVLDPFVDAHSAEVVKVSRQIEQIIFDEIHNHFSSIVIARITSQNIRESQYVITGVINLEDYEVTESNPLDKYYHVSASVINLNTAKIIANSGTWISEKELDYTPTAAYQDSPMYLKDKRSDSQVDTAKSAVGKSTQPKEYYNSLDTNALLVEANTIYENRDYEQALLLFDKAASRADGQIMKTYAGLYETHRKLDQKKDAEQAFAKLLSVSVQETHKLNMKFLFKVNSADFIEEPALRQEYSFWLQQLTKYFRNNDRCFQIVGHSSHSGTVAYNDRLSLSRAQKVQQLMKADFPAVLQRAKAVGKGFRENLVGSGTDDARDAIDRRVEMVVESCSKLREENKDSMVGFVKLPF
jgi:outer membrane protein OmpA-like peptidoglycan-associated protein